MGSGRKHDYPPLLAPGRHLMSLMEVKKKFVDDFSDSARRLELFLKFEGLFQELLVSGIYGDVWLDGSFLTEKECPEDIDVTLLMEHYIADELTDDQIGLINRIQDNVFGPDVDAFAFSWMPRDHPDYLDENLNPAITWHEQYGCESSNEWLKGFVVLKLRESDV